MRFLRMKIPIAVCPWTAHSAHIFLHWDFTGQGHGGSRSRRFGKIRLRGIWGLHCREGHGWGAWSLVTGLKWLVKMSSPRTIHPEVILTLSNSQLSEGWFGVSWFAAGHDHPFAKAVVSVRTLQSGRRKKSSEKNGRRLGRIVLVLQYYYQKTAANCGAFNPIRCQRCFVFLIVSPLGREHLWLSAKRTTSTGKIVRNLKCRHFYHDFFLALF